MTTFVQDLLNGRAGLVDLEVYVNAWRCGCSPLSLQDFLGFTWAEFQTYLSENRGMINAMLVQKLR
ncbi:MAG: hypothetical protein K0R18_389 [Bacillales bacterium]|jgi:hypothetical protein|nr:hypothetical protein [Bacillales bacterium]